MYSSGHNSIVQMSVPSVLARLAADEFLLSTYKRTSVKIHLIRQDQLKLNGSPY